MSELEPEVTLLAEAVQSFVSSMGDGDSVLVSQALVIYEVVGFDEDGNTWRKVSYTCPTDNFSLTGALGLVDAGRFYIRRAILGTEDE
jgi:hypothetical protein